MLSAQENDSRPREEATFLKEGFPNPRSLAEADAQLSQREPEPTVVFDQELVRLFELDAA